jgi:putative hydrolase
VTYETPDGFQEQFLADLLKSMNLPKGANLDLARQFAHSVLNSYPNENNVDPKLRIEIEELAKLVCIKTAELTEIPEAAGYYKKVEVVNKAGWVDATIKGWQSILEHLSVIHSRTDFDFSKFSDANADPGGFQKYIEAFASVIGPALINLQFGSMFGHMAQDVLGAYDVPIPRTDNEKIIVVGPNIEEYAASWNLDASDVELVVLANEISHHVLYSGKQADKIINDLLFEYINASGKQISQIESGIFELSSPEDLNRIFSDPQAFLNIQDSPEQRELSFKLQNLLCVIEGYCQVMVNEIMLQIMGGHHPIYEAMRRRRLERPSSTRLTEALFGLNLDQAFLNLGPDFIIGLKERDALNQLNELWKNPKLIPTQNELVAPGLWLARIEFDR